MTQTLLKTEFNKVYKIWLYYYSVFSVWKSVNTTAHFSFCCSSSGNSFTLPTSQILRTLPLATLIVVHCRCHHLPHSLEIFNFSVLDPLTKEFMSWFPFWALFPSSIWALSFIFYIGNTLLWEKISFFPLFPLLSQSGVPTVVKYIMISQLSHSYWLITSFTVFCCAK